MGDSDGGVLVFSARIAVEIRVVCGVDASEIRRDEL